MAKTPDGKIRDTHSSMRVEAYTKARAAVDGLMKPGRYYSPDYIAALVDVKAMLSGMIDDES